jgi:kynurenine formamidase
MSEQQFYDLSHTIYDGLETYKGLPKVAICDFLSRSQSEDHYGPGMTFQLDTITMVGNSGTYLDSPFHRFADGKDLSELRLNQIGNLDYVIIHSPVNGANHSIPLSAFEGHNVKGKAVLLHTGWDKYWNTEPYFEGNSFLSMEAAVWLQTEGAALVGIDSLNIDDTRSGFRPVHTLLLGNDIPIIEHLTGLKAVPQTGNQNNTGKFFAIPPKMKRVGTFPVRAFVLV